MRVLWIAVLLMLVGLDASALEIKGKWGIGAALFTGAPEVSLLRGISDRTILGIDLSGGQSHQHADNSVFPGTQTQNDYRIAGGPRLRRFFRPGDAFSPYGDVFLSGSYSWAQTSGGVEQTISSYGAQLGLGFGLEYQTRWNVSAAIHSDFVSAEYLRLQSDTNDPANPMSVDAHRESVGFGLTPRVFVRGYF